MTGYALLIPELLLLVAAAWALFAERLPGGDRGAAWVGCFLAALAALVAALGADAQLFGGLLSHDASVRFARVAIALLTGVWLLWTAGRGQGRIREAVALATFSATGALLMTAAAEMITFVLALELATMPAYVLMGYRAQRTSELEGALKYFLLSMLTSIVMLYGLSFVYGLSGTTVFAEADLSSAGVLGVVAALLVFVGLFAKLSAAPFHYWTPDAYEGAEPWSVAFVSTVPKVAGAVVVIRLAAALSISVPVVGTLVLAAAVASMVLGNLAALTQTDVRRMMAYSGVAHTGYLLLAISTLSAAGHGAALFYAVAYALPSMGIMLVVAEEGATLEDFGGLATRRMPIAWLLVVMLVSLIGIPPLAGFFGKLYLFASALDAGATWWVVLAVAMSVVSAGYYLRIVRATFFGDSPGEVTPVAKSFSATAAIVVCVALTIAMGLAAGQALTWLGAPLP